MILFKAADLVWATRIKQTAEALGLPCRPARTAEMLEARLSDSEPSVLIADLDAGDEAIGLIERARGAGLRVLAFGPHVRKDLFQQARDAGASEVMTNGSFRADLPEVLLRLAGRG